MPDNVRLSAIICSSVGLVFVLSIPLVKFILKRRKSQCRGIDKVGKQLREEEFDLDEGCSFCNSGSWSCVPRRFIDRQTELIRQREKNNQLWAIETEPSLIWESHELLAEFVGAKVENIAIIDNTSTGTNVALKTQKYSPGDKILLCSFAYPAVIKQAEAVVQGNPGVELVLFDIPFPIKGDDDIINAYSKALEEHPGIKITVIDHISSDTAILFPVKALVDLCHKHDVLAVIDGAHTPGQIKLTLEDYGADYYVGNLCKWMMIPQNAAFLWVHPKHQDETKPLITSHTVYAAHFRDRFYPPMTKDRICHILVKDAIEFYEELGGLEAIAARNTKMVTEAAAMLSEAWGTPHLEVTQDVRAPHMAVIGLPKDLTEAYVNNTAVDLYYDLLKEGLSLRVSSIGEDYWCRISCHVWNDWDDFERVRDNVAKLAKNSKVNTGEKIRPPYFLPHSVMDQKK